MFFKSPTTGKAPNEAPDSGDPAAVKPAAEDAEQPHIVTVCPSCGAKIDQAIDVGGPETGSGPADLDSYQQ